MSGLPRRIHAATHTFWHNKPYRLLKGQEGWETGYKPCSPHTDKNPLHKRIRFGKRRSGSDAFSVQMCPVYCWCVCLFLYSGRSLPGIRAPGPSASPDSAPVSGRFPHFLRQENRRYHTILHCRKGHNAFRLPVCVDHRSIVHDKKWDNFA